MQFPKTRNTILKQHTIDMLIHLCIWTYPVSICLCTLMVSKNPLENLFFRCCVDPRHLNSPFTMIAKRVQRASHSSMLCDVKTIDFPVLRTFDTIFHKFLFAPGSIPVVGSSNKLKSLNLQFHLHQSFSICLEQNKWINFTQINQHGVSDQCYRCAELSLVAAGVFFNLFVDVLHKV